ncbi:chromosome-associated kinesin KIF4 [Culex quinquefasciatus]|uniref:chromosome-associated kinesin KIF4 n=1 Tax=Culex quinquefasciatus TaxID=7176 RepID=UPI0018E2A246|nr:chromosome-associated kinesin KIF4 [Culex quinquefasciatus]
MADSVKVAVRIRPLNGRERERGCRMVVDQPSLTEPQIVIGNGISGKPEAFTFNYVFGASDGQELLYESAVRPLLGKLYAGYNVTILAYGQTGSGKTFTMGTNYDGSEDLGGMGVIPRAIIDIFERIEETRGESETKVACSFMELYQENLYDLLSEKGSGREDRVVDIREANNQIVIPGLTEIPMRSAEETFGVLMRGSQERAVASTAMNAVSSRSHAIFTLSMTNRTLGGDKPTVTTSKFHLVDLAGSERPKKTQATGERFKEGVKINQGLLVLGNVISALGSVGGPQGHVPYRESKLTRLLQDSLGGNSLTLMVACVSPADYNCEETINTLRYANRAKNIRNKAVVNQDPNQAEIRRLNAIIQELRLELLTATAGKENVGDSANRPSSVPGKPGIIRSSTESHISVDSARRERELQDKIRTLQQQLQSALQDMATDQLQTLTAEKIVEEIEALLTESPESELKQGVRAILDGYKAETASIRSESAISDNLLKSDDFQDRSDLHTKKQMDIREELRKLTKELEIKEELHRRCMGNMSNMTFTVEDTSDGSGAGAGGNEKLVEYQNKIAELEKQLQELNGQLNSKILDKKSKLAEDRRKKVQHLEQELAEVRKKSVQQAKMLQLKEKDTQRIDNLSREIQAMKAMRVKLVKNMRTESENFRQWKINREKEICQLREKDRKLKNEMVRMKSTHDKQQNVLKRKVDEAVAVNRRLKEALERQKSVQAQRAAKATGKLVRGADVTSWVDHELELIRSVKEASVTLKLLMDDRALLNSKLLDMKKHPDEHDEDTIKQQEHDLELRNAQIADLQQKILSTDVDSKQKAILEGIPTLSEAKQAIKKILQVFSDGQEETAKIRHQLVDTRLSVECLEESVRTLQSDLADTRQRFTDETNDLAKMYEEKLSLLLRSKQKYARQSKESATTCDTVLQEASDRMEKLREELDSMKEANRLLTKQLAEAQANAFGRRRTRNSSKQVQQVEYEEDDEEDEAEDERESVDDDSDLERDPDFRGTPLSKRKKSTSVRESMLAAKKKKSTGTTDDPATTTTGSSSSDAADRSGSAPHCTCTTGCSTKRCGCKKLGEFCGESCRCSDTCRNRRLDVLLDDEDDDREGEDVEMNKENEVQNGTPPTPSEKRKSQDDGEDGDAAEALDQSPKRAKIDLLTPTYVYSVKKRKPLLDDM